MGKVKTKRQKKAPAPGETVQEVYMVAKDALEDAQGRDPKIHKRMMKEAETLTKRGRKLDPSFPVPHQLLDLVPFNKGNQLAEFIATATDADGVDAADLKILLSVYDPEGIVTIETGRMSFRLARNEEVAEAAARERVLEDLKNEPEIFHQSFIESHIDMKKLAELVEQDAKEDGYIDDIDRSDLRRMAKQYNVDMEDDEGEDRDEDEVRDEVRDAYATDMAKDPMQRMEDMLGREEAVKWAIEHAGIDYEAAADQALRDDGWIHYMSSYSGDYSETPVLRYVIWRIDSTA